MATYFHGNSEIQADGLQTLILMNPAYVGYSDAPPPPPLHPNFVFLNSAAASLAPSNLSHAPPPQTQQFVSIPLSATAPSASSDPSPPSVHAHHEIPGLPGFIQRPHYNLWSSIDTTAAARDTPRSQQGLSLSLSSQQPPAYGSYGNEREVPPQHATAISPVSDDMRISGASSSSASGISNGVSGMHGVILSSKYLKAAQQLLDEVVNVGNGIKTETPSKKSSSEATKTLGEGLIGGETSTKRSADLSTAERQEIQMKKAKLLNMLDEKHVLCTLMICRKLKFLRTGGAKIPAVSSSDADCDFFIRASGRDRVRQNLHSPCAADHLKAIQMSERRNIGADSSGKQEFREEDGTGGKIEGSRLKFVDHQLRQQRALQQLGMIQQNVWRPQRGLPERSVSVLRAWLFEHFLHPYPKDSDKHMLAKQTGLTRSQVSNWFINARVRLWKPMVEEMYMEEVKDHEENGSGEKTSKSEDNNLEDSALKSSGQQEKSPGSENQARSFKSKPDNPTNKSAPPVISMATAATSPIGGGNARNQPRFTLMGPSEMEGMAQGSPKKPRSTDVLHSPSSVPSMDMDVKPGEANHHHISMKFSNERQGRDGYPLMAGPTNFIGGFESYSLGEIGRFDAEQFTPRFSGNGVSLTLGLPHCENLSLSGTHQTFLPNQNIQLGRRVDMGEPNEYGTINTTTPHSTAAYENINMQNGKRFAAQLLPDCGLIS
ncbi:BEL1-like homeodomain protein 1 [Vitis vinifera]|uniref:BEL1-like homeodomain protein 1 n=1 Tax=Vitis vinifera TaxID=29760 RepID=A0A438GM01_VITVI|nr:BEL1-like homeodomain protein 1 [Vitis vinifera]